MVRITRTLTGGARPRVPPASTVPAPKERLHTP